MLRLANIKELNLPSGPGSYQFYNQSGQMIYIGKAVNLKNRVLSYWQQGANLSPMKQKMIKEVAVIKWLEVETEIEALLLEANLIKKHQPDYNVLLRDDKRFSYIWISTADEIPGVFVVRQINKPGQYFGPFVSGLAVRETIKALRKIWPYCTTRKIAQHPCFYYQLGRCLGACGAKVSREVYLKKVIKPLVAFLSGQKDQLIKDYERQIKRLKHSIKAGLDSQEQMVKELTQLEYELRNMKQILDNTRVLSSAEKFSADTVELAKILTLAKVPEIIEGYDTSNIFGQEAVASLVSFRAGEADKSGYRRFKMRLSQGLTDKKGDVQFLQEAINRRMKHAFPVAEKINDYWPLPDLMIIDGGKAQLNAVLRVLNQYQVVLPVIAISKGDGLRSSIARDKIFMSHLKAPIELSLNSPALHLVKRVRDEAHRFAIGFHRQLRSQHFLPNKNR